MTQSAAQCARRSADASKGLQRSVEGVCTRVCCTLSPQYNFVRVSFKQARLPCMPTPLIALALDAVLQRDAMALDANTCTRCVRCSCGIANLSKVFILIPFNEALFLLTGCFIAGAGSGSRQDSRLLLACTLIAGACLRLFQLPQWHWQLCLAQCRHNVAERCWTRTLTSTPSLASPTLMSQKPSLPLHNMY